MTFKTPQKAFLQDVAALWPLAKGSLALVRRPCIREDCPACRCGEKHAGWISTFRQGGRQRCRYAPKAIAHRQASRAAIWKAQEIFRKNPKRLYHWALLFAPRPRQRRSSDQDGGIKIFPRSLDKRLDYGIIRDASLMGPPAL